MVCTVCEKQKCEIIYEENMTFKDFYLKNQDCPILNHMIGYFYYNIHDYNFSLKIPQSNFNKCKIYKIVDEKFKDIRIERFREPMSIVYFENNVLDEIRNDSIIFEKLTKNKLFNRGTLERITFIDTLNFKLDYNDNITDINKFDNHFKFFYPEFKDISELNKLNLFDFLNNVYNDFDRIFDFYFIENFSNITKAYNNMIPGIISLSKINKDAKLPYNCRLSDIGYDLTIISKIEDLTEKTALYSTGLKAQAPFGYYLEIVPRSSLSKSGFMLANSIGVVDPGYTGELKIALTQIDSSKDLKFPFRCCQLILRKHYMSSINVISEITNETFRKESGYGSTGI
jgi:deoxyuridine 5'-triphosphate nucleotidohydrolase